MSVNRREFLGITGSALAGGLGGSGGNRAQKVVSLNGNQWLIAADPDNVGLTNGWQMAPRADARRAAVPKIGQFALPGYHGVMWYWRAVSIGAEAQPNTRYLLRFGAVFYKAGAYLNGVHVGGHEGGETPFVLDVTEAVRPGATNLLAVRVLDPTDEKRIDDIVLSEVPHRTYGGRYIPTPGGIIDSVELLVRPAVYLSDVWVRPDWKSGRVEVDAEVTNTLGYPVAGKLEVDVRLENDPTRLDRTFITSELAAEKSVIKLNLTVKDWRLWGLDSPTLYRVTAWLTTGQTDQTRDGQSVRCGFRDFRFENGYFRLNGKRLFVRSGHTANHCPVGIYVPYDNGTRPDLIERGMLEAKRMGFNMVRFIGSIPRKNVVDHCDEIGLLLYTETMASWRPMVATPYVRERFERSVREMILRDRNHPSVVMWGLLNETKRDSATYEPAKQCLPMIRSLDPTRFVLFNSGRWDGDMTVGSGSNPGSADWDVYLGDERPGGTVNKGTSGDVHRYLPVPHSPSSINWLRSLGRGLRNRVFLSEYGVGSGQHLPEILELHRRHGGQEMEIYRWFDDMDKRFMRDWEAWRLDEIFDSPSAFFEESLAVMTSQRFIGLNAIRANPHLIGHNVTSLVDIPTSGEGVLDSQRRPKAGTREVMRDAWAPLRLCLFVEPYNLYRDGLVRLDAVLANEDVLTAGRYQVQLRILDEIGRVRWQKSTAVTVRQGEPPLALPFFSEHVVADWPTGKYRFTAELRGATQVAGRAAIFHVTDKVDMPKVNDRVTLWDHNEELGNWLKAAGISTVLYSAERPQRRELILVSYEGPKGNRRSAFLELARRIARGSAVVFLDYHSWASQEEKAGQGSERERAATWLPLLQKGKVTNRASLSGIYPFDQWSKDHPAFAGMPAGGMLDHLYYREVIGPWYLSGAQPPAKAIAGVINTSFINRGYHSGLTLAEYELGAGRFFINTLEILSNLGKVPSAERLLRNLLTYAARDLDKPLRELPKEIEQMLHRSLSDSDGRRMRRCREYSNSLRSSPNWSYSS